MTSIRSGLWLLLSVTLVSVISFELERASADPKQSDPSVDPGLQRYVGTYEYAGGDAEIDALDDAIDQVVSQMNFFVRGIARRRLRKPNLPSKRVVITVENGQIGIDRPGQPKVSAPADGKPVQWRNPDDGEVFQVRQGIDEDGHLYQRFKGDDSTSRNEFRLDDDGKKLTIHTEITADRLPAPLRFDMTYRRETGSSNP